MFQLFSSHIVAINDDSLFLFVIKCLYVLLCYKEVKFVKTLGAESLAVLCELKVNFHDLLCPNHINSSSRSCVLHMAYVLISPQLLVHDVLDHFFW